MVNLHVASRGGNTDSQTGESPRQWKRIAAVVAVVVIVFYTVIVVRIFNSRHLTVPNGNYTEVMPGKYQILRMANLHVPDVLLEESVTIRKGGNGELQMMSDIGETLSLTQGADGLYFNQNFSPIGASILPGIARNWNEGRIYNSDDKVVVEGYMLEEGLMLFVYPFKDVTAWHLELKRATETRTDK